MVNSYLYWKRPTSDSGGGNYSKSPFNRRNGAGFKSLRYKAFEPPSLSLVCNVCPSYIFVLKSNLTVISRLCSWNGPPSKRHFLFLVNKVNFWISPRKRFIVPSETIDPTALVLRRKLIAQRPLENSTHKDDFEPSLTELTSNFLESSTFAP